MAVETMRFMGILCTISYSVILIPLNIKIANTEHGRNKTIKVSWAYNINRIPSKTMH